MNIYIKSLSEKVKNKNKYLNWYISIINNAIIRVDQTLSKKEQRIEANKILGYSESHHILPQSFCNSKVEKIDKLNIVRLSAREHFIVHLLLGKIFGGGMWAAANMMASGAGAPDGSREIYKYTNRIY